MYSTLLCIISMDAYLSTYLCNLYLNVLRLVSEEEYNVHLQCDL